MVVLGFVGNAQKKLSAEDHERLQEIVKKVTSIAEEKKSIVTFDLVYKEGFTNNVFTVDEEGALAKELASSMESEAFNALKANVRLTFSNSDFVVLATDDINKIGNATLATAKERAVRGIYIPMSLENLRIKLKFLKIESLDKINDPASIGDSDVEEVEVNVKSLNPFKLYSEQIEEVIAKDKTNGNETYGYVIRNNNADRWSIQHGYFYNAGSKCFIYGTLITDDRGATYFIPASLSTRQTLPDKCAGYNEAFCKQKNNN